jgi:hypothetical protein
MSAGSSRSFTQRVLSIVEPLIFGRRLVTLAVLAVITSFFFWKATQTQIDAGWMKTVPLEHPYMKVFQQYYKDFGGANTVIIDLEQGSGDIYNEKFLGTLQKVTDEVFFIPGVDRARVLSMFTPNVRYVEVNEQGLSGSDVIPADYAPTPEMFARIKGNVAKAQILGRLVSKDERSAQIVAELLEYDPATGKKLSYQAVSKKLEDIRSRYETKDLKVRIIGFAKVVGDMTDASTEVGGFFLIALLLTSALLWFYVGSFKLAMLPMACALVCVVWEFGLLSLCGFGLDPFAVLVPFLVLAVSVSHGVQYVKSWADEVAKGASSLNASVYTFRALAIAGTIAILADVAGVATIYLIPIQTIREMSLNAVFGMLAIIVTNKVLMPVWLSYVRLHNVAEFTRKQEQRNRFGDSCWKVLVKVTRPKAALVVMAIAVGLLGWALTMYPRLAIGDAQAGVPELRPDSRYNQDSKAIVANYAIGVDMFKVIAEGKPDGCVDYDLMDEVDRFSWRMENTGGVQSVLSLLTYAKLVNSGLNEGRLNAELVPRNRDALVSATNLVPTSTGLLNDDCSALAMFIFTNDHRAQTISHLVAEVKRFNDENRRDGGQVNFALASGNVGVMAASNEVVEHQEIRVVGWVYAVIILFLALSYRTLSGVLCVILPLGLVSALGYAFMASLGIGMKVSTLPVLSLAVGIGVDYGIYIYSMLADGIRRGLSIEEAYLDTLRRTGKSVIFIGVALGSTVATWLLSKLQFQADMGLLLVFLFTANMFGAILVLPALACFLAGEERKHLGRPTLIGHADEPSSSNDAGDSGWRGQQPDEGTVPGK